MSPAAEHKKGKVLWLVDDGLLPEDHPRKLKHKQVMWFIAYTWGLWEARRKLRNQSALSGTQPPNK